MPIHDSSLGRLELPRVTRVVYDKKNGEIVHTHHVMIPPGVQPTPDYDIDAEALSLASQTAKKPEQDLAILAVNFEELKTGVGYAVDIGTRKLMEKGSGQ